jgi:holo-[acyl-carrier protein] synthase
VIVGLGTDLAEVDRIQAAVERYGERFLNRIYTPRELAYALRKANKYERLAARFAAKEAGMKAIGTGWRRGVTWKDFEVANLPSGRPTLLFHGRGAEFARELNVTRTTLSLTHTEAISMAVVILESD